MVSIPEIAPNVRNRTDPRESEETLAKPIDRVSTRIRG
ncbi:hypothetical protein D3OALGA1CA_4847 [Olavius algarvensis associated proteobacterium Delta 3]|nr:hypothetical protein D3OALGB2SA_702 [Olavius algarvensis associated proteobacterium Delta 3]CAB5157826.1 hypothetical protein D3OALGA1CA_4847 [Olavius algarvensis associated proteobacterium Delta 3]